MSNPFFTVIIPTFNRSELLREAIQSVLCQTFHDFELIIVDDHSTDNTIEVVSLFHDNRIIYIVNDRKKGSAGARNAGIFMAKGEWITFLDSDDTWLPHKLEQQYHQIEFIDDTTGFIYTGYCVYDFTKKEEVITYLPQKEGWIQYELLYTNYITGLPSVAVRKDIIQKVGGFDENFLALEDWELYIRLAGITKFRFLKKALVHVRKLNNDRLSQDFQRKLNAILLLRQKYNKLYRRSPRLCHRIATIILMWSLQMNDWRSAIRAFPWTAVGIIVDPYNFIVTMRGIYFRLTMSKRLQL